MRVYRVYVSSANNSVNIYSVRMSKYRCQFNVSQLRNLSSDITSFEEHFPKCLSLHRLLVSPPISLLEISLWFNYLFTRDARIELKQRVQQHTLVKLAQIVIFVPSTSVETPGAAAASLTWLPATSGTRAPDGTPARGEHPRLGRLSHRQLVLGELVLARWFGRVRRAVMMTMMMVMVMQTIAGVQLALLVRLRMVPCGVERIRQDLLSAAMTGRKAINRE